MLSEASWALSWRYVGSSWPLLGHLGAKMANKRGKMATKSAKMNQDGRTWVAKANEGGALPGSVCAPGSPPRALEFAKRKDQRGRQDLAKNLQVFDEVILHAGSPFGDGGYPVRYARKAATVPTSIFEALLQKPLSPTKIN